MEMDTIKIGGFYAARNKRKWIGLERAIDQAVKRHEIEKIPKAYPSRLIGPSTKWQTFFRQQDAFKFCRRTSKDLHVFAYESETFEGGTGQRMYLVASYPVFWHYYNQMHENQRHHYEVIPEGAVCKLYFDLEYNISMNPGRDGDKMVDILIQLFCEALKTEFGKLCSRTRVLDLDASTSSKFSRHLVFQMKNVAFRDNVHAGKFVYFVMSLVHAKVSIKPEAGRTPNTGEDEQTSVLSDSEDKQCSDLLDLENKKHTSDNLTLSTQTEIGNNSPEAIFEEREIFTHSQKSVNQSKDYEADGKNQSSKAECNQSNETDNVEETHNQSIDSEAGCVNQSSKYVDNQSSETGSIDEKYEAMLEMFTVGDLQQLIVKNKHGDDVYFCDLGVYTKNRNFRLYLSSKLGKVNPLLLSPHNIYKPKDDGLQDQGNMFMGSLVANVLYSSKVKILTFEKDCNIGFQPLKAAKRTEKHKKSDTLEGYNKSPYPEVDDYITNLITQDGGRGVIRHWTYFQHGELLVYEIAKYRYCHNIGRQHRSNNIMYIVDLREGIFYQKCHDPDCQLQNYKSTEWSLPANILPASYFSDLEDDLEAGFGDNIEMDDEELLNTTVEMEHQYHKDKQAETSLLDDGEDDDLVAAACQLETSLNGGQLETSLNGDKLETSLNGGQLETSLNGGQLETSLIGGQLETSLIGSQI